MQSHSKLHALFSLAFVTAALYVFPFSSNVHSQMLWSMPLNSTYSMWPYTHVDTHINMGMYILFNLFTHLLALSPPAVTAVKLEDEATLCPNNHKG